MHGSHFDAWAAAAGGVRAPNLCKIITGGVGWGGGGGGGGAGRVAMWRFAFGGVGAGPMNSGMALCTV